MSCYVEEIAGFGMDGRVGVQSGGSARRCGFAGSGD